MILHEGWSLKRSLLNMFVLQRILWSLVTQGEGGVRHQAVSRGEATTHKSFGYVCTFFWLFQWCVAWEGNIFQYRNAGMWLKIVFFSLTAGQWISLQPGEWCGIYGSDASCHVHCLWWSMEILDITMWLSCVLLLPPHSQSGHTIFRHSAPLQQRKMRKQHKVFPGMVYRSGARENWWYLISEEYQRRKKWTKNEGRRLLLRERWAMQFLIQGYAGYVRNTLGTAITR